jgi:cell wall-associated NlpC family hydrolase
MTDHADAVHRDLQLTNPPIKGPDVKKLQAAINDVADEKKQLDLDKVHTDSELGAHTVSAAARAAEAIGLKMTSVHEIDAGTVDKSAQSFLRHPEERGKDARERAQQRESELEKRAHAAGALREKIVAGALWGTDNEPSIHYAQSRPIDGIGDPRKLPLTTDCSGFATDLYQWSGAPDPNGSEFNGQGFTGTMLQHCKPITKTAARPGDLVVFGSYPGTHVVVLVEPGTESDPLCVSHGQEVGPIKVPVSVEIGAHAGQAVTYCSVL